MNYPIKLVTGYRADQYQIISSDDAHKAYYLFLHPDKRTIFSGGIAIRGEDIKSIEPAWHEAMGWNPTHQLDSDDWNEIRDKQLDHQMRNVLSLAKEVAMLAKPEEINMPLSQLVATTYQHLAPSLAPQLREGAVKSIGQVIRKP